MVFGSHVPYIRGGRCFGSGFCSQVVSLDRPTFLSKSMKVGKDGTYSSSATKTLAGDQTHQVPFFQTLHLSMVDARLYLLLALLDQIQVALLEL